MTNIRILVEQPEGGATYKATAYDEYGAVAQATKHGANGRSAAIAEVKVRVDDRIDGEKNYTVEDLNQEQNESGAS